MSVTNAISSVIIVGAIIAGLAGDFPQTIFNSSSIFGFLAISLAAINIFGGFLVTQRMLAMYKKRISDDFTKLISCFLFDLRSLVYFSFKRFVIPRNFTSRKFLWYSWNDNCSNCYFFCQSEIFLVDLFLF